MDRIEAFFSRALKLHHLRILVLLGQWGQLRIVAQKLHVSPPAISRYLAELESGLGTAVVRRVGNRLLFTAAGQALLERAREVIFQLEQAQQELSTISSGLRGEMTIGSSPTIMQNIAVPLVLALKERVPGASVNLIDETSDKLYNLLCNGSLQLLFSRLVPGDFSDGSITGEVLAEDPLRIVCARNHPLANRESLHPTDLQGHCWVLPPPGSPAFQALNAWMHERQVVFGGGSIRVSSVGVHRSLLESGTMLGLMSQKTAHSPGVSGKFKILELPDACFLPAVWMFHNPAEVTSVVQLAMDFARQITKNELPY